MNRRELLRYITLLTGATVVGADVFLTGCRPAEAEATGRFTDADVAFLDEIAETIIPRTDTPGAKDAQVGRFMADFVTDCYEESEQAIFKAGMNTVDLMSQAQFKKPFTEITPEQRQAVLRKAADESRTTADDAPPHYFTLFQQLTLLGYFTSEPGYTQVLRFEMVPGRYEGCIDYKPGETAWANN